jgi:hypothetical protein
MMLSSRQSRRADASHSAHARSGSPILTTGEKIEGRRHELGSDPKFKATHGRARSPSRRAPTRALRNPYSISTLTIPSEDASKRLSRTSQPVSLPW